MAANLFQKLRLDGFLSFQPGSTPIDLRPLNVLIGPNGSGKSNLIEAFELVRAAPTNLGAAIRTGGGPAEWVWKGGPTNAATIEFDLGRGSIPRTTHPIRYRLEFSAVEQRVEVIDEAIEEVIPGIQHPDLFHYRFQRGRPVINIRETGRGPRTPRSLERSAIIPDQSILSQRKEPDLYPELTRVGQLFGAIQTFRDWTFGRFAMLRQPQPADLPEDTLLPDARNLGLVLNQIAHADPKRFDTLLHKFFPRFERMSTRISGGTVQFFLHESDFKAPIPATRLSDGTLRFVALLATLLAPKPPPLVCIEEPELGLHPDAMTLVANLLLEASERTQLVVTTHSDALVSALSNAPDSVVTCERLGAGTVLTRLDPKDLTEWLEKYRLGDLWRMGQLGANP